jgi:hypothetical protein
MDDPTWNKWDEMWWQIAAKPWIDDAKAELAIVLPGEVESGADDMEIEDVARSLAYECAPVDTYTIEALAEIYPLVWEYACGLDDSWGPGTEHQALQSGIAYYIFYELLNMLPHDEEPEEWRTRFNAQYAPYIKAGQKIVERYT